MSTPSIPSSPCAPAHPAPGWYNRTPAGTPSALITLRDPAVHKQRRRTWDRAFSSASVKNYDELVRRRTRELLAQLERRAGQVVDLSLWLSFFS